MMLYNNLMLLSK